MILKADRLLVITSLQPVSLKYPTQTVHHQLVPVNRASLSDQPAADYVDTAGETSEATMFSPATSVSNTMLRC